MSIDPNNPLYITCINECYFFLVICLFLMVCFMICLIKREQFIYLIVLFLKILLRTISNYSIIIRLKK